MGRTLGLIAGSGRLPFEVAAAAREMGVDVAVVAIEEHTDPAIAELASRGTSWIRVGELGRLIQLLQEQAVDEVILAGAIAKRDAFKDPSQLGLDARALALMARLKDRGDDALLRAVAGELESEGLAVVESTRYLQDRLTPVGRLAGPAPEAGVELDLAQGLRVARSLGAHDVGQSVVVKEGTVLAVEAAEGTDAMMRRAAELGGAGAVVVKAAKPGQDLRFDVPAIGLQTIELARRCEMLAIGLEAERTLLLDRARTLAEAERHQLAVIGLRLFAEMCDVQMRLPPKEKSEKEEHRPLDLE